MSQSFPGVTLLTGYLEIEQTGRSHNNGAISARLHQAMERLRAYALDEAWVLYATCTDYVGREATSGLRRHDQVTVIVTGDARDATQFKVYELPALQRDESRVRLTIVGGQVSLPATGCRTVIVGQPLSAVAA